MATATESSSGYSDAPRGLRGWLFIFILCATQLFAQIALCYIIVPLNEVSSTFGQTGHEHAAERNWHVAAYSLTIGSFILVTGRLGDIYGAKNIFVIGWVWFGVWSIICGCSALTRSVVFFDVSRGLQGIGPALLLPNALAIAARTFPPGAKKNMVFCMIAMCAPLGGVIGGLVGSAFAQYVWWPWVMWISGIACLFMAVMAYFVVPKPASTKSGHEKITIDWIGSVLGVGGLILLNVSWNQAPIDGWSSPYVYVLLIIGILLLVLFYFQEKRAKHPITDTSIFNARVIGVLFTTALGWSSFGVWFYYMFQFLQQERGVTSLGSAIQFIPGALSGMVAPIFTAWAIPRMSSSSLMIVASSAFFIGSLLQALAPVHQSYWFNTFWSFFIMAWGMDVSFPASALFVSDSVPVEHQGISASLVNTVINYSIAIGLGIAGTVEVELPSVKTVLDGYRAAQYTSVGLSGAALILSLVLAVFNGHKDEKCFSGTESEEPQMRNMG